MFKVCGLYNDHGTLCTVTISKHRTLEAARKAKIKAEKKYPEGRIEIDENGEGFVNPTTGSPIFVSVWDL